MGYTHYWQMSSDIAPEAWSKIKDDAAKLIAASPTKLATDYETPEQPPVCNDDEVLFNSANEDEACETFNLTRARKGFEFCKTRGYPYDGVVCAVLAVAAEHAPDAIKVSSDGGICAWSHPVSWASTVLGRAVAYPISD